MQIQRRFIPIVIKMLAFAPQEIATKTWEYALTQELPEEGLRQICKELNLSDDDIKIFVQEAIKIAKKEIVRLAEIQEKKKALKSGDENQRINAVLALGELGNADSIPDLNSIPDLIAILQNGGGSKLRGHAAYALGRLDAYEAVDVLRSGLEDEDDFVRRQCAWALRRLGEEVSEMPKESFMRFAHQMGGPMQAIRSDVGYLLELLKEEGKIDKSAQEQLEAIDTHATRLCVMLDNLTYANLAKDISQKEYIFHRGTISELIRRAAHPFKYVAKYRGIEIRIDESIESLPEFEFDRYAMFTAFVNLIDNAVKFSYPDNFVDIAGRLENNSVSITISDFGIGIPKEEDENIFDLYYKGRKEDAVRYTSGGGLGLFVTKKIIKEHGGEISVSSRSVENNSQGQLVEFTVELPLQR